MKGFIIIATAMVLSPFAPISHEAIIGPARIMDGDTLQIGRERIRLFGIDAPQLGQSCNDDQGAPYACGIVARGVLQRHVGNAPVTCEAVQRDEYGHTLARCYTHGEDLNRWMVASGWAMARGQLTADYFQAEAVAQDRHLGMWRGQWQMARR
jgi:endonuclease YncB( thermonuclease family)